MPVKRRIGPGGGPTPAAPQNELLKEHPGGIELGVPIAPPKPKTPPAPAPAPAVQDVTPPPEPAPEPKPKKPEKTKATPPESGSENQESREGDVPTSEHPPK